MDSVVEEATVLLPVVLGMEVVPMLYVVPVEVLGIDVLDTDEVSDDVLVIEVLDIDVRSDDVLVIDVLEAVTEVELPEGVCDEHKTASFKHWTMTAPLTPVCNFKHLSTLRGSGFLSNEPRAFLQVNRSMRDALSFCRSASHFLGIFSKHLTLVGTGAMVDAVEVMLDDEVGIDVVLNDVVGINVVLDIDVGMSVESCVIVVFLQGAIVFVIDHGSLVLTDEEVVSSVEDCSDVVLDNEVTTSVEDSDDVELVHGRSMLVVELLFDSDVMVSTVVVKSVVVKMELLSDVVVVSAVVVSLLPELAELVLLE